MMGRLDDIKIEELHEVREQTEEGKPRERVLAAIGRKQGDEIGTLAERHGVVRKTIRNWLDRFEEEPIEDAPYDAPRSGCPSKLDTDEREELFQQLQERPTELGYDRQAWSAELFLHHVKEEYGVEYSKAHAYTLLREGGLSWRTARPRNNEADPEEEAEFQETVEKKKTEVRRKDRRCCRSVHKACWNSSATRLVSDWFESDDRNVELMGQTDGVGCCHR